jgi:hypothetical protein
MKLYYMYIHTHARMQEDFFCYQLPPFQKWQTLHIGGDSNPRSGGGHDYQCATPLGQSSRIPGANPTILGYNAIAVKKLQRNE